MECTLPPLREEIAIVPGPRLADGQPGWILHDPVCNQFFQIDWPSFELLSRWDQGDAHAIVEQVSQETALQVDAGSIDGLLLFLRDNLLLLPAPGTAAALAKIQRQRRGDWKTWLLHNYLCFRLPLVKPDAWLDWMAPHMAFFFTTAFLRLTLAIGVLGLVALGRDWARFSATLIDTLTWQGAASYAAAMVLTKVCHELGHALTAKRAGCRVPAMGVAFLVLWPVAYTDTNEAWKLARREQRLAVAGAGIVTELAIAAWATLAWAWLPDGVPRQIAFLLATTTWMSTLAINASPFMRFDGYFLLSDYLGLPNLHSRSFALARWDLRERLFALGEPPPEHFPRRLRRGLILFAWAVWVYRLVLFLGIAALVYHFFIKAVGIFLFIVEIAWFVALPMLRELKAWRERWPVARHGHRARRSVAVALLAAGLLVAPWPQRVLTSGLLEPHARFALYAPAHARLESLPVKDGQRVAPGQTLVRMASPDLDLRAGATGAREDLLAWQSASAGFDASTRKDWNLLDGRLAYAKAEQSTVLADARRYAPAAPYPGMVMMGDPDLRPGAWLKHQEFLGDLVSTGRWQVITYVDEEDIQRIAQGDRALFIADGMAGPALRLRVAGIGRDASRTLNEPELSSLFGGHVQARETGGLFHPERAVYRVVLEIDGPTPPLRQVWRGNVAIAASWEAPALRFVRAALAVVWREAGF